MMTQPLTWQSVFFIWAWVGCLQDNYTLSSGTFTLLVRQGNDRNNKKMILESYNNVNLDPFSPRYVAKVIGDQKLTYNSSTEQIDITGEYPNASRYIRVKN